MAAQGLRVENLRDDLSFGSQVWGATRENLRDPAVRDTLRKAFEARGLLVFQDVEQSCEMQLAISDVFGKLKDHPVSKVSRAAEDLAPGIIDLNSSPEDDTNLYEVDGQLLHNWLPWHFDHSYNNELNRAGVLRAIVIAPEGGLTRFACGIDLYDRMPAELRKRIEDKKVIYSLDLTLRFGQPDSYREVKTSQQAIDVSAMAKDRPRSIHPAVWTRPSGEKILHVGALHALGVLDHEDPEGEALLQEVCRYIRDNPRVYSHKWSPGQMLIWDNWRLLHAVSGASAKHPRRMHRTTIKGDYGLGCFEGESTEGKVLEPLG
jgi:taurine dioxygenase